ncbi:MAG: peptide chain release factor N(5)-glutamine methyltransferase [Chloroflexota bacterium]|nr:peptide chain release factor N(5)-glutamine methyltransferase [Chloroflexota bacterium]MDQ5865878.1 peptide chain release factor N(5)-glutamine methyltransferase [Chloroflexota bacterium]
MNSGTIGEALLQARKRLSPNSSTPQLDAEVILSHVLGMSRASLLARLADPLGADTADTFHELVARRTKGEPVAYITGHKEFYGLDLLITRDVLVPRPETESVVEACLEKLPLEEMSQLADIGTGSGAILVSVLVNRPLTCGFGTEISPDALEVARQNCARHGVADRATLLLGDLLEPLPGRVNVIAANLPYVSPGEASPDVATWEPNVAVFGGGEDGTETIRRFLKMAPDYLLPGGTVVMETAYSQGRIVSELAQSAFPGASVEVRKDLAGYDRIVLVKTR